MWEKLEKSFKVYEITEFSAAYYDGGDQLRSGMLKAAATIMLRFVGRSPMPSEELVLEALKMIDRWIKATWKATCGHPALEGFVVERFDHSYARLRWGTNDSAFGNALRDMQEVIDTLPDKFDLRFPKLLLSCVPPKPECAISDRPALLLDINGVLSPLTSSPPGGFTAYQGGRLLLSPRHGEQLRELSVYFDVIWASFAEGDIDLVASVLGLPRFPVVQFPETVPPPLWKLLHVVSAVGERPCAWVDDDLIFGYDRLPRIWAAERKAPTLLLVPDPLLGLTDNHVQQLRDFAHELLPRRIPDQHVMGQ